MYNEILSSNGNELVQGRLDDLKADLRGVDTPTRAELQAEVIGRLNRILALGNSLAPLREAGAEGPAVVGDITENLALLNRDAQGIVAVISALEQDAARLFNLTAAVQNTLRQQVREQVFCTTRRRYLEAFITDSRLGAGTASYDFGVGMATLPFIGESAVAPSKIEIGVLSAGSLVSPLANLTDGQDETYLNWMGPQLELVFTFAQPTVINRIRIGLDDYQGLNLDALTSSPDGVLQEDLLSQLLPEARSLDGSSNKFSGDVVLDFDPRHAKQIRLVLSDRAGVSQINLRGISFLARRYSSTGTAQTAPVDMPDLGIVTFRSSEQAADQLTSISHQISFDGMQYRAIGDGERIDLGGKRCWLRAVLSRMDSNFASMSAPLEKPGQDPALSPTYTVKNISTNSLGSGVLERTINLDLNAPVSAGEDRTIVLRETPVAGTFSVYQGLSLLGNDVCVLIGSTIRFIGDEERPGLTISYQTSAFANAGLVARREFYTPRLYEISLERMF